ncbi:PH domain-containing protein [Actinomadura vinacea]|uniref:PH domain-containing protein n=1 Tax=Actinomadura vinacea TaxID=115336 RepID=A0ABP5WQS7_9ACTN
MTERSEGMMRALPGGSGGSSPHKEHGTTGLHGLGIPAPAPEWRRPHPRSIAAALAWFLGPLGASALGAAAAGGVTLAIAIPLGSLLLATLIVAAVLTLRYATTRYRADRHTLEIRSGLLFRRRRTVPLDRIRGVHVTADPLHRLLGLATLTIGTGEQVAAGSAAAGRLTLSGIGRAEARELRTRLLEHAGAGGAAPPVASIDWRWIRYAPLTPWAVGGVGIAVGTCFRVIDAIGLKPQDVAFLRGTWEWFADMPPALAVTVAVVIVLVAGGLGATAGFVETWWKFLLQREDAGTFTVLRGLLTTRSTTIRSDQVRGAQLTEPLPLRWAGGARANAIAVGLGSHEDGSAAAKTALLPPAPRRRALEVIAVVLGSGTAPMDGIRWAGHPRVAQRRRDARTVWCVLPPLIVLTWLALHFLLAALPWTLAFGALATAAGLTLAQDAYRSLGHALSDEYLLARSGTINRRSVALRRTAITGWTLSQSPFQRRHGLITVAAATAAGKNVYRVHDAAWDDGLALADAAVPGLLAPFLTGTGARRS